MSTVTSIRNRAQPKTAQIDFLEPVGENPWGEGMSAKRFASNQDIDFGKLIGKTGEGK